MCLKDFESSPASAGLVLEGGGLRGIFTAGVLDYFLERGLSFPYAVGVSAGACNLLGFGSRQIGHTRDCMIQKDDAQAYYGVNELVRSGKMLNLDQIFYEYPYHQKPFDFDQFFASSSKFEFVVTDCETGKAEYLAETQNPSRLSAIGKASSSMPLFTEMVSINGRLYMDGGVADPIPIQRALNSGSRKNVVILTRQKGTYPEMPFYQKLLFEGFYRKRPRLLNTILNRMDTYRKELSVLEQQEQLGHVFVIRPTIPQINRLESNYERLMNYYQHGYQTAKKNWQSLTTFLSCKA